MKLFNSIRLSDWVADKAAMVAFERLPDFVIGTNYMSRWFLVKDHTKETSAPVPENVKRSRLGNIYLHKVTGSDDDRALHDHPWFNISIILAGSYNEVLKDRTIKRARGDVVFRSAKTPHRLEVVGSSPVWSIFITGPKIREWGFHCPKGWVHWKKFTSFNETGDSSNIGRGCE